MMPKKIIWNYDDIHSNLLVVMYKKETIGYFKMDSDDFVIISESIDSPRINIVVLKQIVDEYPEALSTARKMIETE
tara:strand:- start:2062 stop:2289 length:228 start_codon:yes stop_codon:yes gene_type:complete